MTPPETDEHGIWQEPDDRGRIYPEHVVIACLVIAAVALGLGAAGHQLKFW